jgi:hypothetical protein
MLFLTNVVVSFVYGKFLCQHHYEFEILQHVCFFVDIVTFHVFCL